MSTVTRGGSIHFHHYTVNERALLPFLPWYKPFHYCNVLQSLHIPGFVRKHRILELIENWFNASLQTRWRKARSGFTPCQWGSSVCPQKAADPHDKELIIKQHFSTTLKINITTHIASELSTENNLQESLLHLLLVSISSLPNQLCTRWQHHQDAAEPRATLRKLLQKFPTRVAPCIQLLESKFQQCSAK